MIGLNSSKHHLILLLGVLNSACTLQAAENELPELEATITVGSELQMCRDVAEVLVEHRASYLDYCGTPIPIDNSDYELVDWQDIDPAQNIELVQTIYYWSALGTNAGLEAFDRQFADRGKIDEELMALYWPKAESQILALIAEGEIELGHSSFDIDNDGVGENLYRMTQVGRARNGTPPLEQEIHQVIHGSACADYGLPGATKSYTHYVHASEIPFQNGVGFWSGWPDSIDSFFKWKGRIYWTEGGSILEPQSRDAGTPQICYIQTKTK